MIVYVIRDTDRNVTIGVERTIDSAINCVKDYIENELLTWDLIEDEELYEELISELRTCHETSDCLENFKFEEFEI